ncbi:MAG TPA: asparaginase [Acidimicrobiia bacterium]|nr:asparaginase [Acidimicrobiia bacterium]
MIVVSTRSGLVEAEHPVIGVAMDAAGTVIATLGGDDVDREFFMRSAAKPFQATVAQRSGAGLGIEQLAMASASHGGQPVHVALVRDMLAGVGLEEHHLVCPPDRPSSLSADRLWAGMGHLAPERVFHNCSGKHGAMLRACVASDWSLEYAAPDHPLQREIGEFVAEVTSRPVGPVGVDGCGIPTLRTDVTGLARAFARLVTDPDLRPVAEADARFGALTSDGERPEATLTRWFPGPVKGGALGCIGAGWLEGGIGFATKCWSGQPAPAVVGLVTLMDRVGILPHHPKEMLEELLAPAMLGGGRPVGHLEAAP